MDKKFDYSEFELGKLTYSFSELTPEQADEKRALYEQFVREKEEAKAAQLAAKAKQTDAPSEVVPAAAKRPAFRPTAKPVVPPAKPANSEGSSIEHPLTDAKPDEMQQIAQGGLEIIKRPVFKPTQKPAKPLPEVQPEVDVTKPEVPVSKPTPPAFRPTMKPGAAKSPEDEPRQQEVKAEAKAVGEELKPKDVAPRPAFQPTMKPPKPATPVTESETMQPGVSLPNEPDEPEPRKATAAFRPTMKPKLSPESTEPTPVAPVENVASESVPEEPVKPKPAPFRPTMKPKPAPPKAEDGESA